MLEKGTKVRVLGGAFAGKVGVVSELEGKRFARVTLGLMTARVALEDLKPAGEGDTRTALLRSSHWRPDAPAAPPPSPPRAEPARTSGRPRPSAAPARGRGDTLSRGTKPRPPRRGSPR